MEFGPRPVLEVEGKILGHNITGADGRRLLRKGKVLTAVDFIPLEDTQGEEDLAQRLAAQIKAGAELIILAGETAIMDIHDIAPRAVERAGGVLSCYGAPVDPGNLLLLAYLDDVPILGAPGCVRSPKRNIIDIILPRLLAGDRLNAQEIASWGHGGLLEDVRERPYPRRKIHKNNETYLN